MLVLTRSQIRELVPMPDAIELMKMAFAELSAGRTVSPLRTVISLADREGDALFMPAYVPAMDALGLKTVSVFRRNPERGLPVIHAIVGLVDPETGQPLAIMDGTYLTALRTGAVSGAAADLLARADSHVLAAIGAGAQGVTQIAAVCAVRPIERVIAVDVSEAALERLRQTLRSDWPEIESRLETTTDVGRRGARGGHHLHRNDLAHPGLPGRGRSPGHPYQRRRRLHAGDARAAGRDSRPRHGRRRRRRRRPGRSGRPDHPAPRWVGVTRALRP